MSVSNGVSDGAEDRVDAFVLSSIMSRVVGSIPHAQPGAREFSLGGVLWKTVLYALTYVAAFACGWFLLFDQNQDWVRMWVGQGLLLAVLSGLAVVVLLGRYEDGKERPGPWFVVLSLPCAPGFGVISGSGARYSGGVFRWILVSVAVLVAAGVSVFPLVMRLVRNGFASWAAMVVLCVVPSWMLAKATGSAGASLFWCCVVGLVGVVGARPLCAGGGRRGADCRSDGVGCLGRVGSVRPFAYGDRHPPSGCGSPAGHHVCSLASPSSSCR